MQRRNQQAVVLCSRAAAAESDPAESNSRPMTWLREMKPTWGRNDKLLIIDRRESTEDLRAKARVPQLELASKTYSLYSSLPPPLRVWRQTDVE